MWQGANDPLNDVLSWIFKHATRPLTSREGMRHAESESAVSVVRVLTDGTITRERMYASLAGFEAIAGEQNGKLIRSLHIEGDAGEWVRSA